MTITLVNKTNRMKVIVLLHDVYCRAMKHCTCRQTESKNRRLPNSITLPAKSQIENLHEAILQLPWVIRAVKRGQIRVVQTVKLSIQHQKYPKRSRK